MVHRSLGRFLSKNLSTTSNVSERKLLGADQGGLIELLALGVENPTLQDDPVLGGT